MSGIQTSVFTSLLETALGGVDTFFLSKAAKGGGTLLRAAGGGGSAAVRVPTLEVSGLPDDGSALGVDFKAFTVACKGRSITDVTSNPDTGELILKGGSAYKANLTAVAASENNVPQNVGAALEAATTSVVLTDDNKTALSNALRLTKIERTYSGITDTLVYVEATDKVLLVACFEPSQVAYIRLKNKDAFPECAFVLPSATVAKITALPGKVSVQINESSALFRSKTCDVLIPLPIDTINAISPEQVLGLIKATVSGKASSGNTLTIAAASLAGFLENASSVIATGADIALAPINAKSVGLTVTTPKGVVKEKFDGKLTAPFNLGYAFMKAIVSRAGRGASSESDAPPTATVSVSVTDLFAVVRDDKTNSTYIAALSE